MSRFSFTFADKKDDEELCSILANNILDGKIAVSFRRSPSYFDACKIQGKRSDIIKCTEKATGKIIAIGSRFIHDAFINGKQTTIGYLGDLRGEKFYRKGTLLARGYKFLKELHKKNPVPFYTTMIWDGNNEAMKILTSNRAGLPVYKPLGKFLTPAIFLGKTMRDKRVAHDIVIEKGTIEKIPEIFLFINAQHAYKQFAPIYDKSDFATDRLRGLKAEDFYLAVRDNKLMGVIAAWDQSGFRQTHIEHYNLSLRLMKPLYNYLSPLFGYKPLIEESNAVPFFYTACIAIKENDPEIFTVLLRAMYNDRCHGKWHYFICGLHECDPLCAALNDYKKINTAGHLFCVYYPEDTGYINSLDNRIPYIEAATL